MNAVADSRGRLMPLAPVRRPRPLGEDIAPPRPLYFTQIPLILAFTGVVAWVTGAEYSTAIASFVGGVVGCYMLWDWLVRGGETRFSTIIAFGLLIGYGLGAFNTWATTSRGGLSLGEFMGDDDAVLARGIAAVLISCAVSIFIGELFERPLLGRDFRIVPDPRTYSFIYLGAIMIAGAFATGGLTVSGASLDSSGGGQIGVFKSFVLWIFPPLVTLAVTIFLITPQGGIRKILSGGAALMLLMFVIIMGRRVMIYTVMETIFLARIAGVKLKGSISKKMAIFGLVAVFVVVGALGFMLLRIAGYGGAHTHRSLPQRLVIVAEWISEGSAVDKALTSTQSNVKTRTFVLGFFANVLEGSSLHTPGLGENAVGLLQLSIPSAIYPAKDKFYSEEGLTDRLFGFSYGDEANSLLTNGATDFGLAGAIVYPLLVAWILRTLIEFASWRVNQDSILLLILAVIYACMQTENSLTSYGDTVIHGTIFAFGFVLFFSLPRIRLKN
jgi:hypothetical protein